MAEHETKGKEEKEEAKRRKKAEPIYDQLKEAAEPEDNQADQAEATLKLQQTYGNRYVQRLAEENREATVDEDIVRRIESQRGSGKPLEPEVRSQMEAAFGEDFGDVRVHADSEAASLSQQLEAKAFTTEKDIFFAEGAYKPRSEAGIQLIDHELTHVVQQEKAPSAQPSRLSQVGESAEVEAEKAAQGIEPIATIVSGVAREVFISSHVQVEGVIARQEIPTPGEAGAEVVGWVFAGLAGIGTWEQEERAKEAGEMAMPEIKRLLRENPGYGVLVAYHFRQPDPSLYDPAVRGQIGWTFLSLSLEVERTREEAIAVHEATPPYMTPDYVYRNIYSWVPPLPVP